RSKSGIASSSNNPDNEPSPDTHTRVNQRIAVLFPQCRNKISRNKLLPSQFCTVKSENELNLGGNHAAAEQP
ncbi:MAG: hypothetical protein WAL65_02365, partial [Candidatus Sulfotelmatobacter sp.]